MGRVWHCDIPSETRQISELVLRQQIVAVVPPTNVDFDGTGHTNFLTYIAGSNPLGSNPRFALTIAPVPG